MDNNLMDSLLTHDLTAHPHFDKTYYIFGKNQLQLPLDKLDKTELIMMHKIDPKIIQSIPFAQLQH